MILRILPVIVAFGACATALAYDLPKTGYDLLGTLQRRQGTPESYAADGFIAGIADLSNEIGGIICIPADGITYDGLTVVVRAYLETHPKFLHLPASRLVQTALMEAFPCKATR